MNVKSLSKDLGPTLDGNLIRTKNRQGLSIEICAEAVSGRSGVLDSNLSYSERYIYYSC